MTKDITIDMTGLRERPTSAEAKAGIEQPYHMTSILRRLFPSVEWSH